MEEELVRFKNKKKKSITTSHKTNKKLSKELIKLLLAVVITLGVLIMSKSSKYLDKNIKKYVFESTFDFSKYMNKYSKYFTEFIPFENIFKTDTVFNEELKFSSTSKYLDGIKLTVSDDYLVPAIESGLVVFIGEKENYGNVVIVQQVNGIDTWYGGVDNIAVDLYDYVEKGSLIGEAKEDFLYLVLEKEGNYINYEEYS